MREGGQRQCNQRCDVRLCLVPAALTAAGYNVKINLNSLEDKSVGEKLLNELKELETKADELEKEIRKTIKERGGI